MIGSFGAVRIVVAMRPVDFRKGHDGLAAVAEHELGVDPHSGVAVVFRSVRFQHLRAIGGQGELTGENVVDAPAQDRPVALVDIEASSEIEQGALAHLGADAFGAHEAEGELLLGAAAGLGAPDEHGVTIAWRGTRCNTLNIFYGTTSASSTTHQSVTCEYRRN